RHAACYPLLLKEQSRLKMVKALLNISLFLLVSAWSASGYADCQHFWHLPVLGQSECTIVRSQMVNGTPEDFRETFLGLSEDNCKVICQGYELEEDLLDTDLLEPFDFKSINFDSLSGSMPCGRDSVNSSVRSTPAFSSLRLLPSNSIPL